MSTSSDRNSRTSVPNSQDATHNFDIVVVGGAFSGTAFALVMKRRMPDLKILVVERSEQFERKVGEATVEVSSYFLRRVLGLYDHLSRHHLPKHGLRYWFTDERKRDLYEMTEVGSFDVPGVPSFQLDRPTLDGHLLEVAAAEGIEVWRPAKVKSVDFQWPIQHSTILTEDGEQRVVRSRWVIDASGRQAFLSRKLGMHRKFDGHPTAALWGRWTGVLDLDDPGFTGSDPRHSQLPGLSASRRLATNHFCGYGWWCWVIPLRNGTTSIGLVYNKDLFQLPAGTTKREAYEQFVRSASGLGDLVADAALDDRDFMALQHLPYRSEKYMDLGWALVGDAAAFIDPYYSPGLDHVATSIYATAAILEQDLRDSLKDPEVAKQELAPLVEFHNKDFTVSFDQWFGALYDGKYEIFGDADLTRCAFQMDTGLYYAAVVSSIEKDIEALKNPVFGAIPQAVYAYKMTRWFNQRLVKLARFRRRAGLYGESNVGRRFLSKSFYPGTLPAVRPITTALRIWLKAERQRLFYRLRHGKLDESRPVVQAPPAPSASLTG